MSDVERWGDAQQYRAEPHDSWQGPERGVMPKVTLLWMTPDPLGAVAAMAAMYEGRVVRSLDDLTVDDRRRYWKDVCSTHLDTPLEAITFHFLLEGVDRSFTHQLVRKRVGAAYAQESLRFAVPGKLSEATSLPPSLQGTHASDGQLADDLYTDQAQSWRNEWDWALREVDEAYHRLVASGMPAEEARGLLPHAVATRAHYLTNLRSLKQEAGNRLCTQAQFHWRVVMVQIVNEIRRYHLRLPAMPDVPRLSSNPEKQLVYDQRYESRAEEFGMVADLFRPVCYELGRCPFQASFDRSCTIRQRVQAFSEEGVPSSNWDGHLHGGGPFFTPDGVEVQPIRTEEWLANPGAARRRA